MSTPQKPKDTALQPEQKLMFKLQRTHKKHYSPVPTHMVGEPQSA